MNQINRKINSAWSKSNALYTKAASVLGIGFPEMMVLYALEAEGSLTQKQISENYSMQKQTVNTVIKSLDKRGYVVLTAGKADKREKTVSMTDNGQKYAKQIIQPIRNAEDKVYRNIGEERLQTMYETLDLFNLLFERELNGGLKDEQ